MKTLGESTGHRSFIVEMSREEYHALEQLQRVSEERFGKSALQGLGADMSKSVMAVIVFVQVQDVIGRFEEAICKMREVLKG